MDHKRELSKADGDVNESQRSSSIRLAKTTTLHVQHTFSYFFIIVNTTQENDFLFLFLNFHTDF